jgi:hypothetical protein
MIICRAVVLKWNWHSVQLCAAKLICSLFAIVYSESFLTVKQPIQDQLTFYCCRAHPPVPPPPRRMKSKPLPVVPLPSDGSNVARITTHEPNFEKLQYAIIVKQDNNDGLNRRHGSGGNIRIPLIFTSFKNDQRKNTVLFQYRAWRPCLRPCTAISDVHRFRRIVGEPQIDTFRYVTTEEDLQKYKRDAQGSDFAH